MPTAELKVKDSVSRIDREHAKIFPGLFKVFSSEGSSVMDFRTMITSQLGERAADVVLIGSEFATNAVRHGTPKNAQEGTPKKFMAGLVELPGNRVFVYTVDTNPALPKIPPPEETRESGRGLQIVEEYSLWWNYTTDVPQRIKDHFPHAKKLVFAVVNT